MGRDSKKQVQEQQRQNGLPTGQRARMGDAGPELEGGQFAFFVFLKDVNDLTWIHWRRAFDHE